MDDAASLHQGVADDRAADGAEFRPLRTHESRLQGAALVDAEEGGALRPRQIQGDLEHAGGKVTGLAGDEELRVGVEQREEAVMGFPDASQPRQFLLRGLEARAQALQLPGLARGGAVLRFGVGRTCSGALSRSRSGRGAGFAFLEEPLEGGRALGFPGIVAGGIFGHRASSSSGALPSLDPPPLNVNKRRHLK